MSALAADIALATRRAAIEAASDGAVVASQPNARDLSGTPVESNLDAAADALAVATARLDLLKVGRRRFRLIVDGLRFDLAPGATTAALTLTDAEVAASALPLLVARVAFDFGRHRTEIEGWG